MTNVKGKKVLVMGLGRFGGGVGVTRWLVEQGAQVTVTDLKSAQELKSSIAQLKNLRIKWILGKHDSRELKKSDLIVVNPAVKPDSPYLKMASKWRIPLTTEINLFMERCPAKIIGITGTNGKETVVRMVYSILSSNVKTQISNQAQNPKLKRKVWLGGNIGKSLLGELKHIKPNDLVVLELSSFQLAWLPIIKKSPNISVVVNITPDHLDWHKTMPGYLEAKRNIVRFQKRDDFAVLNWRDKNIQKIVKGTRASLVKVQRPLKQLTLRVPGEHNLLNATLAAEVGRLFGIPLSLISNTLVSFHGIPHVLEYVGKRNEVQFYDDSAATTPEATIAALSSFHQPVILIAGGYDKKINLKPLMRPIKQRTSQLILIGQTGRVLHKLIPGSIHAGVLDRAVKIATSSANPGDIVILSPAAASFDQFENLEERGTRFKELVLQ
ncbi:UDP-N-acetylmuramoyl-L-alanine--D-glutamate ligase [Candidatus Berkelbacteria bacterium]|nr:UDP-N-acetylmuramoyl-L-alanine--D-glutamate ligase [Candidatus Berkelbacteria bacterium]